MFKTIRLSAVSKNLALRSNANAVFDAIEKAKDKEIVVDFTNINSMSRSFAQQYLMRKAACRKKIIETNISDDVAKMFDLVKSKRDNSITYKAKDFEVIEVKSVV